MRHLGTYAALAWSSTSDTAPQRVHQLAVPLREAGAAYTQATYRAQSLDRSTVTALQVAGGAHEYVADVRYDDDPQSLVDLLRAGNQSLPLTYYPDVRDPTQAWTMTLISPAGDDVETQLDPQRGTFGDHTVQLRLRRVVGPIAQHMGTNVLFWYRGGGSLEAATFARASATASYFGPGKPSALLLAASGKARTTWVDLDGDGTYETAALLLDKAITNAIENGSANTDATGIGQNLATVTRDSAFSLEGGWSAKIVTTNAADSGAYWTLRSGSRNAATPAQDYTFRVWVYLDPTTAAPGMTWRAQLAWYTSGGAVISTTSGTTVALVPGWNPVTVTGVAPALTATVRPQLYTTAAQGINSVWADAAQLQTGSAATSPLVTSTATVTGVADAISWPLPALPQAMTVYVRYVCRGVGYAVGPSLLVIGDASTTAPYFALMDNGTNDGRLFARLHNGSSSNSSAMTAGVAVDDVMELRATMSAAGVVTLAWSKNGGAETVETASAALTVPNRWSAATVRLPGAGAAVVNVVVVRGTQTRDAMRRIARIS